MTATLKQTPTYLLDLEDRRGRNYTGRLTGVELVRDGDVKALHRRVFLTDDERLYVYVEKHGALVEIRDDPAEKLREWLNDEAYIDALNQLGIKPVVDV